MSLFYAFKGLRLESTNRLFWCVVFVWVCFYESVTSPLPLIPFIDSVHCPQCWACEAIGHTVGDFTVPVGVYHVKPSINAVSRIIASVIVCVGVECTFTVCKSYEIVRPLEILLFCYASDCLLHWFIEVVRDIWLKVLCFDFLQVKGVVIHWWKHPLHCFLILTVAVSGYSLYERDWEEEEGNDDWVVFLLSLSTLCIIAFRGFLHPRVIFACVHIFVFVFEGLSALLLLSITLLKTFVNVDNLWTVWITFFVGFGDFWGF